MAACGNCSTVAVTEEGELLAWGKGEGGHLGLGTLLHQQQPARAGGPELFANQSIRLAADSVACGGYHTMAVTAAGHAWTCGCNKYGQLGVGDKANRGVSQRGGVDRGARVDLWPGR